MLRALRQLLSTGCVTQQALFPDLPVYSRGLPQVTAVPCQAREGCTACVETCPTAAIALQPVPHPARVTLDLGQCIACGGCVAACPTGTIAADKRTTVAVQRRQDLILTNHTPAVSPGAASNARARRRRRPREGTGPFRRSLHIRAVSTGDNASDLEVAAATNPIFDASRFGIHCVAAPRFADALLITGPVARAMQEPLRRCYDAMAAPGDRGRRVGPLRRTTPRWLRAGRRRRHDRTGGGLRPGSSTASLVPSPWHLAGHGASSRASRHSGQADIQAAGARLLRRDKDKTKRGWYAKATIDLA